MKLLEFITFCELKGLILRKEEVDADWDPGAESHWKIVVANGKYKAMIAYAVLNGTGLIMSSSLYKKDGGSFESFNQPDIGTIVSKILG